MYLRGTGSEPNEFFIVPLKDLNLNVIAMAFLKRYQKDIEGDLRFDRERQHIE